MKLAVAILISGSGSNMAQLVKSMDSEHPAFPSLVISNRSNAKGLEKARRLGVPTEVINDKFYNNNKLDFEKKLIHTLKTYNIELICLAGFMKILSKEFINNFKNRILNIHPSLLPKYKGLNTHARALEANDAIAGCSVHLVTPELDGGPVIDQIKVKIEKNETERSLAAKVLLAEHILYPKVLFNFANKIKKSTEIGNTK